MREEGGKGVGGRYARLIKVEGHVEESSKECGKEEN